MTRRNSSSAGISSLRLDLIANLQPRLLHAPVSTSNSNSNSSNGNMHLRGLRLRLRLLEPAAPSTNTQLV